MIEQNQNLHPGTVFLWGREYAPVEPSRRARKVVQVSGLGMDQVIALCDDGTMWELKWLGWPPTRKAWVKLPDIPQDNKEQP